MQKNLQVKNIFPLGTLVLSTFLLLLSHTVQGIGISLPYFFPTGDYFSAPVPPLAFKDLGVNFGKYAGVYSSVILYRIGGMRIGGLPFQMDSPAMGPQNSLQITLTPKIIIPFGNKYKANFAGGAFFFRNFSPILIQGNMDKHLKNFLNPENAQSSLSFENKSGAGWVAGGSLTYMLKQDLGIELGILYYKGASPLKIRGSVSGYSKTGGFSVQTIDFPDSFLDYSGIEVSIGISMKK